MIVEINENKVQNVVQIAHKKNKENKSREGKSTNTTTKALYVLYYNGDRDWTEAYKSLEMPKFIGNH